MYHQRSSKFFLRSTSNYWQDFFGLDGFPKKQALSLLGGYRFKLLLKRYALPTNNNFAGVYNFANSANFRYYFLQFLKKIQHDGLIMCHPGLGEEVTSDPLQYSRPQELAYLLSDNFLSDLSANDCILKVKPL